MKANIAAKWIEALNSGEYKKGVNRLRSTDNSFCCLGVLCNLHAQAHPTIAAQETKKNSYMGGVQFLPHEVKEWAGLKSRQGFIKVEKTTLAELNDNGMPFDKIAKIIKKHQDGL